MCGFVGAFDLSTGFQPIDEGLKEELRNQVLEMSKTIRHRGPDWSGVYTGNNAILSHERLSIVDPLSGKQPLVSDDGKLTLEREEHPLNTEFPTEVRVEGRVTDVSVVLSPKIFWSPLISCKEVSLPRLLILFIFAPLKANKPIEVKFGSTKFSISKEVQLLKA